MLVVSIASAQQKAPAFAEIAKKAVEASIITSDQMDQLVEINAKFNKEQQALKKQNLSDEERKAENKRINDERTKEFKAALGKKWADWKKFRDELTKKE